MAYKTLQEHGFLKGRLLVLIAIPALSGVFSLVRMVAAIRLVVSSLYILPTSATSSESDFCCNTKADSRCLTTSNMDGLSRGTLFKHLCAISTYFVKHAGAICCNNCWAHAAKLCCSSGSRISTAGRPARTSSKTTPKAYTSVLNDSIRVWNNLIVGENAKLSVTFLHHCRVKFTEMEPNKLMFIPSLTYEVTFSRSGNNNNADFAPGYLKWTSTKHSVRSPIAIIFV
ncbi:hypothetical protein Leryth_013578 [Lithospermum erythrorhizon]|nr:hypothetical protein Leryth_013578 [Lithospermum erythrorhizon]